MKNLYLFLLIFTGIISAQDYHKEWEQVIRLENDGKIRSAAGVTENIYKKARKQQHSGQLIKTFFYRSKYMLTLKEDAQNLILKDLRAEIARSDVPTRALLNVIYAKCLADYLKENSYKISQIRDIDKQSAVSIKEWSRRDFQMEITRTFEKALSEDKILKSTSLSQYKGIFDYLSEEQFNSSSLYEYILNEQLAFVPTGHPSTERQESEFFDNAHLFADVKNFLAINTDSIQQPQRDAIIILQRLEAHNPSLSNTLQRLNYSYNKLYKSDTMYLNSMDELEAQTSDKRLTQKLNLQRALIWFNKPAEQHPDGLVKSLEYIEKVLSENNHSNSYGSAITLRDKILQKQLRVKFAAYVYQGENSRMFVSHRNITGFSLRYYKIDGGSIMSKTGQKSISAIAEDVINKATPSGVENYSVKNSADYRVSTSEFLMPKLGTGLYLLEFDTPCQKCPLPVKEYQLLTVTDIVLLAFDDMMQRNIQVLDRKTGAPIEDAIVQDESGTVRTDKTGRASLIINKARTKKSVLKVSKAKDTLTIFTDRMTQIYSLNPGSISESKVELFLDRAIYRPGQQVFYKGILFERNGKVKNVVPDVVLRIYIENPDDDEILSFDVTSNQYGSFHGNFVLPQRGMTGRYHIYADSPVIDSDRKNAASFWDHTALEESYQDFVVEEYKRPTFEVKFEPVTNDVVPGETVTVIGSAASFDGSLIAGANVKYSIGRRTFSDNDSRESHHRQYPISGTAITDLQGKFTVTFVAVPDINSDILKLPVDNYFIEAEVTDISGETRIASRHVKVGYHGLQLGMVVPPVVKKAMHESVVLSATNLNNVKKQVSGQLLVYFLEPISKKFKKPLWWNDNAVNSFTNEEFDRLFPYEQRNISQEPLNQEVYSQKIELAKNSVYPLDFLARCASGKYKMVFKSTDSRGYEVETSQTFDYIRSDDVFNPSMLIQIEQLEQEVFNPRFIKLKITSPIANLSLQLSANWEISTFERRVIKLNKHMAYVQIRIPDHVNDNVDILAEAIFDNQFFAENINIDLPNPANKVTFNVGVFRNKIEPGITEKWSFTISSKSGAKDFEVLASMYDSSLDFFGDKRWEILLFQKIYSYSRRQEVFSISDSEVNFRYLFFPRITPLKRAEDIELMWFGFNINNKKTDIDLYQRQVTRSAAKPTGSLKIAGYVSSGGDPIGGVKVSVHGTLRTTKTDFDGYYEIEAAPSEDLLFSATSYLSAVVVAAKSRIDISLQKLDDNLLEPVIVNNSYTSVTTKSSAAAVPRMLTSEAEIDNSNEMLLYSLQGKVSGLNISKGSGQPGSDSTIILRGVGSVKGNNEPLFIVDGIPVDEDGFRSIKMEDIATINVLKNAEATSIYGNRGGNGAVVINTKKTVKDLAKVSTRKNLSETAFFLTELYTDPKGNFSFSFTSPEALTAWKLRMLAHDKHGNSGVYEQTVITQKDIMLTPNMPRFFREKDTITIQCKISNITSLPKSGTAMLQLSDAVTMQNVDGKTGNGENTRTFTIPGSGTAMVSWKIVVPEGLQGMQYKVVALSGDFSDGEENIIPVLTNNMLVTESVPLWVTKNSSREFVLENLKQSASTTLRNHQLTLEYTSNPAWLAIQSLPYLMDYEHECAEQTFARFYANAVAGHVISSNPKIEALFKHWEQTNALLSPLDKNTELKSIILAETPWLNDAADETILKKNMALLFDLQRLRASQSAIFKKLANKQNSSGGFPWFEGGTENAYITRHIIAGFGKMELLDIEFPDNIDADDIIENGIEYLDEEFLASLRKAGKNNYIPYDQVHYLYSRSFFLKDYPIPAENTSAVKLLVDTMKKDWLQYPIFNKAMAALIFFRLGDKAFANKILTNLKETAVTDQQIGMYWLENRNGRYWYQSPIETQALIIEAFAEITTDKESIDALKVWLIRHKQRNNWPTTKSTTEAIYSLLLTGTDVLSIRDNTVFTLGDEKIMSRKLSQNEKEAGTGYIKLKWGGAEVDRDMAKLTIQNKSDVPGYGGLYWQYFEDLDKIKDNEGAVLSVSKQLFISEPGNSAPKLVTLGQKLKIGDKLMVRLTVTATEDAEFVHLKDMRASCFEPEFVKSEYKWSSDIGYYMSTRDAATHFFFDEVNKGTYILEYDIRVNNNGDFSNGVTTIQSMYAPEFASHTEGIRVSVGE